MSTPPSSAYYRRVDDELFEPLPPVQGAWRDDEQHLAPLAGLLVHALDRHEPREDLALARVGFDILGFIAARPTTVRTRTLRAGRSIELLEAEAAVDGRVVVTARAWRLLRGDTEPIASVEEEPMPGPDGLPPRDVAQDWPGGFIRSLEARPVEARPGRGRVWLRTDCRLIEGETEPVSPHAQLLAVADAANGMVPAVPPTEWLFPNTDLTMHLHRLPRGPWLGLDTRVSIGADGVGLTATVLHDLDGPCGRMAQILTLRPRPLALP